MALKKFTMRDTSTYEKFCKNFNYKKKKDSRLVDFDALQAIYDEFKPIKRVGVLGDGLVKPFIDHPSAYLTADHKDMILSAPYVHECWCEEKAPDDETCHVYQAARNFAEKYGYDLTIYYPNEDGKRWYKPRAASTMIFISKEDGPNFLGYAGPWDY